MESFLLACRYAYSCPCAATAECTEHSKHRPRCLPRLPGFSRIGPRSLGGDSLSLREVPGTPEEVLVRLEDVTRWHHVLDSSSLALATQLNSSLTALATDMRMGVRAQARFMWLWQGGSPRRTVLTAVQAMALTPRRHVTEDHTLRTPRCSDHIVGRHLSGRKYLERYEGGAPAK